jgi:hypothetical protein
MILTFGIINMFASIEYKQVLETKMAGFQEKIADPTAERATGGLGSSYMVNNQIPIEMKSLG